MSGGVLFAVGALLFVLAALVGFLLGHSARGALRRPSKPVVTLTPEPVRSPAPTPVQRLAAAIEEEARKKAQAVPAAATADYFAAIVTPPPRQSLWVAPAEPVVAAPEPEDQPRSEVRSFAAYGKPPALPAPRDEGPDELTLIRGVDFRLARRLEELGVYHFDQIAAWDRRIVVWVENQFAARGRVTRERWVEQARDLARLREKALRSVRG